MAFAELAADLVLMVGGKNPSPRTAAIIVSAGNSSRMGGKISKQFLTLGGKPVLAHTLLAFQNAKQIDEIVVVAKADAIETVWEIAEQYQIKKLTHVTRGGDTRAASVQRGFRKINPKTKFVAIHDGARCLITPEQVGKVCRVAYRHRAATAATAVTDTVKLANRWGFIEKTLNRDRVFLVQTPQVFHADLYRAALASVKETNLTDDNQLMEKINYTVKLVDFGKDNIKITTPDDIPRAEFILSRRKVQK
ncbi:MAG: 2-C-methyl-D-erythritol 4-phosphate cytidylyltransferase [Ruminococcaceae bacterium]|nr:2-C-methyl-D-erythritol 4-phosphate cytidylyltransferase [Oscillospiraceae bacterium]